MSIVAVYFVPEETQCVELFRRLSDFGMSFVKSGLRGLRRLQFLHSDDERELEEKHWRMLNYCFG